MSLLDSNGNPVQSKPNRHQLATVVRKLHLEPNDIIVITDSSITADDFAEAFAGYSCGHSTTKCRGHLIISAPGGMETITREQLLNLLGEGTVTNAQLP